MLYGVEDRINQKFKRFTLEVPGVLTHCNPVPQMLSEHSKAREFVRNMENAIQTKELNKLAVNAGQYARLLKEHIYKEDNIL